MVLQNYQNFIEMTSNMIYIVAVGDGLKCLHKIHLKLSILRRHSLWTTPCPLCLSTIVAHLKLKITLKLRRETYFILSSFILFFIYFCTKSHAHKKILSESTKVVTDASMGLGTVVQNPSKSK